MQLYGTKHDIEDYKIFIKEQETIKDEREKIKHFLEYTESKIIPSIRKELGLEKYETV